MMASTIYSLSFTSTFWRWSKLSSKIPSTIFNKMENSCKISDNLELTLSLTFQIHFCIVLLYYLLCLCQSMWIFCILSLLEAYIVMQILVVQPLGIENTRNFIGETWKLVPYLLCLLEEQFLDSLSLALQIFLPFNIETRLIKSLRVIYKGNL